MDRRDLLYEQYEDALFALLMDRVAEEEGARLIEENERLRSDPNAEVPERVDRRSRKTIRRAFAGRRRHTHSLSWILSKAAVAVLVAAFLFVSAYAFFPEVRVRTLNVLIQSSNVASKLSLTAEGEENGDTADRQTLAGYALPDISESFIVTDRGETSHEAWIKFSHPSGSVIRINIVESDDAYFDSQDADISREIEIHGYPGMLIQKGETVRVSWFDSEHEKVITLSWTNADKDVALFYAEEIVYIN